MPTVFGREGDSFYEAFYEPDQGKRRAALSAWVEATAPALASAIKAELEALVDKVTEGRWTTDGWRAGEQKLRRLQGTYQLVLTVDITTLDPRQKYRGTPSTTSGIKRETPSNPARGQEDDGGDQVETGRSSNDDRSDSMNPNNASYQAAMDNHANQTNPNNAAYWSSRGY